MDLESAFGKRIVITNRHDWSTEEILLAYQGQSQAEAVFRQLKDDEHLAMRPQYQWTDHKIHVHAFICVVALLLARIVEFEARKHGWKASLSSLLEELRQIRLAMVLHPSGDKGGRPRADWQLEVNDRESHRLFRGLAPSSPPFVYTDGAWRVDTDVDTSRPSFQSRVLDSRSGTPGSWTRRLGSLQQPLRSAQELSPSSVASFAAAAGKLPDDGAKWLGRPRVTPSSRLFRWWLGESESQGMEPALMVI